MINKESSLKQRKFFPLAILWASLLFHPLFPSIQTILIPATSVPTNHDAFDLPNGTRDFLVEMPTNEKGKIMNASEFGVRQENANNRTNLLAALAFWPFIGHWVIGHWSF